MKKYILISFVLFNTVSVFGQKSLTLEESKQLALRNNVSVKNSVLEMEASAQIRKAAMTKYFPSVSAGGTAFTAAENLMEISTQGGNLPVYDGNPVNVRSATQFAYMPSSTMGMMKEGLFGTLTATQPVFAGGRIWNGNRLASLGEEVSEQKNRLAQNEVVLKTEEQYWRIISLDAKYETIRRYEDLLNRLLGQVTDAYSAGLVSKNDLLKVQVKRSEVLLNKSKLENGRLLAVMAFCQYIGVPYDSTLSFGDTLTMAEVPHRYFVDHAGTLKNRPEFALLQASVRAEELQSNMKIGEYLPQAAIGAGGVYMRFDKSKERTVGMIFGTVSIPISGWWEASHVLSERTVKEDIARNTMNEHSDLLLLQMQKAWTDLNDAYKQVLLSKEAKRQADENFEVNRDSYDNGMISVADLLEAQAMQQQLSDQLIDAMAGYRKSLVTYLQATGR